MSRIFVVFAISIILISCSKKQEDSQIVPLINETILSHEQVYSEFKEELQAYFESMEKDQQMFALLRQKNLSQSDKEKLAKLKAEGTAQMARMESASDRFVDSTVDLLSLASATYGVCGDTDIQDNIASLIATLQSKYADTKDVESYFRGSIWEYENEFSKFDSDIECMEFSKIRDKMDVLVSETTKLVQTIGA